MRLYECGLAQELKRTVIVKAKGGLFMSYNPNQQNNNQQGGFNPQNFQQYANAYDQGQGFDNMSHQDVYNHYQQAAQQIPPDQMYQAHQQYYQQMPQPQRQGLLGGLMSAFQSHGISPQQAGIQGNQPYDPSPQNLANATQYATQQPDIMSGIFGPGGALSSPLAKAALAGGLAIAAKQFLGGGGGLGGMLGGGGGGGSSSF